MNANKFVVIPNSVNTDRFYPDPVARQAQRLQYNWPPDLFVIGIVARFSPQKGHAYLIDAAAILKKNGCSFKLVLIGIGPLEEEIRKRTKEYGLDDYVCFFGQSKDIPGILQAFDCFVLPSLWEGMPLSLLEAMATGLAVIGTDVSGIREVIEDGLTGILIPAKEPEAIANAVMGLIKNPDYCKKLTLNAFDVIREKFSIDLNLDSYLKLYEE